MRFAMRDVLAMPGGLSLRHLAIGTMIAGIALSACSGPAISSPPDTAKEYQKLQGWLSDNHAHALQVFLDSCAKIETLPATRALDPQTPDILGYGTVGEWLPVCSAARQTPLDDRSARKFFETWFVPETGSSDPGTITGYFEPVYRGSLTRHGVYQYPILSLPPAYAERLKNGETLPSRAEMNKGAVNPQDFALVWLSDPLDAFLLHVQGSGVIDLDTGKTVRVGFAAKNGLPYTSIGGVLVRRGELSRDDVSMQTIRKWVEQHPDQASALFEENDSYIFFRLTNDVPNDLGPVGAQGVHLTARRSLAVDRSKHPLGVPVWLETQAPTGPGGEAEPFRRLMVAQDTGSAIKGDNRGDVFWGRGPQAGELAGRMDSKGLIVSLRLRTLDR